MEIVHAAFFAKELEKIVVAGYDDKFIVGVVKHNASNEVVCFESANNKIVFEPKTWDDVTTNLRELRVDGIENLLNFFVFNYRTIFVPRIFAFAVVALTIPHENNARTF
ncbi:MAG: hypothetical protein SVK08_01330 [Halobacteriota archaeon]|nr:hypothetical protein [Halobacteriota archaeon]